MQDLGVLGAKALGRTRKLGLVACVVFGLVLVGALAGAARAEGPNAIITSSGCQSTELPANDDGSSPFVSLPFTINFFGDSYSGLWVNNNGNVTFNGALGTYTPFGLGSTNTPIIAPFFGDVWTFNTQTVHYGDISAGATEVGGHAAFCVNWVNVGYYAATDKLNSFQLVIIDRSDTGPGNFDIEFNYDKVQWETGSASGGTDGLGGSSAHVGYSNGTTTSFELPGSGVPGSFLDTNTVNGLIYNNINSPFQAGRYIFPVRNGIATGHSLSGTVYANDTSHPLNAAFVQACPMPADTPCRNATTNSGGQYLFTNLPDSTSGGGSVDHTWNLTVNPPGGSGLYSGTLGPIPVAGADVSGQDVILHGPQPLPQGASVNSPSFGNETSGTPTVYWQEPFHLSVAGCTGGVASATITYADGGTPQVIALTEGPAGTYTGEFAAPYPHHGAATISYSVCSVPGSFSIYIDPSGTVETTGGTPIAGATVTLLRSDDPGGPFTPVPDGSAIMSPANQTNPDTSDSSGHFGWDVLSGYYIVEASKAGCTAPDGSSSVQSPVLTVPPAVTDLVLQLNCPTADTTGPSCGAPALIIGPPKQVQVAVQDTGSGLALIQITKSTNATTPVPSFTAGTTSPVVVTATKINQSKGSVLEIKATDVAGNVTVCDPWFTLAVRDAGKPVTQEYDQLAQDENEVTLTNGSPGVDNLEVDVNGHAFRVKKLGAGQTTTIDVSSAMHAGADNTVTVTARGKPGGSVDVVVSN